MYEWDRHNISHIARHQVTRAEAEEALTDPKLMVAAAYHTAREQRFAIIGSTAAGRILFVAYTMRGTNVRVVTAYTASRAQQRRYGI